LTYLSIKNLLLLPPPPPPPLLLEVMAPMALGAKYVI
jgi:hypothetical protein